MTTAHVHEVVFFLLIAAASGCMDGCTRGHPPAPPDPTARPGIAVGPRPAARREARPSALDGLWPRRIQRDPAAHLTLVAGRTYFVRPDGGKPGQCTGLTNRPHGRGSGRACALAHPFYLFPPGGEPVLRGGDTLVIGSGQYRMGLGAPGAERCSRDYPWDCHMPPVPSGTAARPTRILGAGWDAGCPRPPRLFGVERAARVLSLAGSSHVELACLEVTDNSGCVEHHRGGIACARDTFPYGDWAGTGLFASDSKHVTLRHLDLHGLANTGVHAGRLADWTLEDVRIAGNGWVGWNGDLAEGSSSNEGRLLFRRVTIEWNGCGETHPEQRPVGCWGQSAGGYGDGLGTALTAGEWIFEDCRVVYNTSDGLDLLYHSGEGSITVRRLYAQGNAGNPLKVTGNALVESSVLVGDCGFFRNKSFTYNVDDCRARGNTLEVAFTPGARVQLLSSTLYGQGDILVSLGVRGAGCTGGESFSALNNIFVGDRELLTPDDRTALLFQQGCPGLEPRLGHGVVFGVKGKCPFGPGDRCEDPRLGGFRDGIFDPVPGPGSPALDAGKDLPDLVTDVRGGPRRQGKATDCGAVELEAQGGNTQ